MNTSTVEKIPAGTPGGAPGAVTVDTPVGPFTAVVGADGVIAAGFTEDATNVLRLSHPDLRTGAGGAVSSSTMDLERVARAVRDYFAGDLGAIDTVRVRQLGPPLRSRVWRELRQIPAGRPVTYTQLAERCGQPTAVRAAASGCATNAVALFVPCHRVIRTDGGLGGYLWGLEVKKFLLAHERNA